MWSWKTGVGLASLCLPLVVMAQPDLPPPRPITGDSVIAEGWMGQNGITGPCSQNDDWTPHPITISLDCTGGGGLNLAGRMSASQDASRISSTVTGVPSQQNASQYRMDGSSSFNDFITVSGPETPAMAVFHVLMIDTLSTGGPGVTSLAYNSFGVSPLHGISGSAGSISVDKLASSPLDAPPTITGSSGGYSANLLSSETTATTVEQLYTFGIPVTNDALSFTTMANIVNYATYLNSPTPQDVNSYASATTQVLWLDLLDSDGNSIVMNDTVTSISGRNYLEGNPNYMTSTPEPSSIALVGIGLLGLVPRMHRRRQ